jgi:hypothetical protein
VKLQSAAAMVLFRLPSIAVMPAPLVAMNLGRDRLITTTTAPARSHATQSKRPRVPRLTLLVERRDSPFALSGMHTRGSSPLPSVTNGAAG